MPAPCPGREQLGNSAGRGMQDMLIPHRYNMMSYPSFQCRRKYSALHRLIYQE